MVDKGVLLALLLLLAFGLCLLLCRLAHFFSHQRLRQHPEQQQTNEVSEPLISEDLSVGQTLRRQSFPWQHAEGIAERRTVSPKYSQEFWDADNDLEKCNSNVETTTQKSNLILEVISGPSAGLCLSQQALRSSSQFLTLGRVPQNDLVLNDPEVSGKHAFIRWSSQKSMWELVDMGSLNGTLVNWQPVSATQSLNATNRQYGNPVALSTGDIVTFGSTSQVRVQISSDTDASHFPITSAPFGVGAATDSMTIRKGGKRLPMEDVCMCEWPLRGLQQFGAFCVFDGHGGAAAAAAASRIMPQKLSDILGVDARRAEVLSNYDATDVLREAFNATEEALDHEYEGCTATVLLLWCDTQKIFYAQCANVGDSACIFSVGEKLIQMTEDHRLTSFSEKSRLLEMGKQLKEGETRLCGMNIARVLGDKFLKDQDGRFSSRPFVSEVVRISKEDKALGVIASDGLWDVLSPKRAIQMAFEARDGFHKDEGKRGGLPETAKDLAELLVNKARMLRTKDNTSVIVLDFLPGS